MSQLASRRIVLGVSGGIAAYKSVELCRQLVDLGAHVVPVMTADAHRFIGPVTLSALASEPVHTSLWDDASAIPHTQLGQTADIIVVAPATARVLSAYATGSSEDLLTATLIATRAPVVVCPAMHTEMWEHPAVQSNIEILRSRGVHIVEPETGRLAGGDIGAGRLASTENICAEIIRVLGISHDLLGLDIVVTAGGTREPIDAVRVIANRSSGKQGIAIAKAAFSRGAEVTLILANSDDVIGPGIEVVRVETAAQMGAAVESMFAATDLLFMAAAVADARPTNLSQEKIKKDNLSSISLVENPDILKALSAIKGKQIICAFAAETNSDVSAAGQKMRDKGADLIYLNDVSEGQIFGSEQTSGHIIDANGLHASYRDITKDTLAHHLLDTAVDKLS